MLTALALIAFVDALMEDAFVPKKLAPAPLDFPVVNVNVLLLLLRVLEMVLFGTATDVCAPPTL